MERTLRPDKILRELSDLWVQLAAQQNGESAGVIRACAMTLIVVAEQREDSQALGESLAALMKEVPSRTIVLRPREDEDTTLESRVLAQCWMPLGRRQQICCEQVEIDCASSGLPDLHGVLLPLLAPDLPVVLWCRSERVLDLDGFRRLLELAGTLVLDSSQFDTAGRSLDRVREMSGAVRRVADLAWTRLTPWRETVAQVFENPVCCVRLEDIDEIRIQCAGNRVTTGAWYLAAWLSKRLPRARRSVEAAGDSRPAGLAAVALHAPGFRVSLSALEATIELRINSTVTHVMLPPSLDAALIVEELSILGRDRQFDEALEMAALISQA